MSCLSSSIKKLSSLAAALSFIFAFAGCSEAPASGTQEEQLNAVLDDIPLSKIPGVILLVDGPEGRYELVRGVANRETKSPMRSDFTLRGGSISKTYVAALSVMASREGALDLDATIDQYLGVDVLGQLPEGLNPTVRQLLNHTSGVPDYYSERFYKTDWNRSEPLTPELVLHAIRGLPATIEPGEGYAYSNTNYHLAAIILEKVNGKPIGEQFQEKIIQPLGLMATYYDQQFPPGDEIHGYGSPFGKWEDTFEMRENSGPDGGMFASASDFATWIKTLFSPDGAFAAIGAEMVNAPVVEKERKFQGMGVEILQSRTGAKIIGHTGAIDGYLTAAFYAPDADTVIVLHINRFDDEAFSSILGRVFRVILSTGNQ